MNERIRQLADQARFVNTIEYPHQDEVFEKFAELIVRECLDICDKTADEAGCYYEGAATCIQNIKQHFGVEDDRT